MFLVYRWFFSYVTGRLCRANLALISPAFAAKLAYVFCLSFAFVTARLHAQIALPPPPAAEPPPMIPPDRDPAVQRRLEKSERKLEGDKIEAQERVEKIEAKKEELIREDMKKPRLLFGFFEMSLLYPKASVSKNRKDYHAELTTHVSGWARIKFEKPAHETQIWAGLRLAPFGGTGTQEGEHGRFALTYFGPGIGFGRVSETSDTASDSPTRHGWLINAGIAMVSRLKHELEDPKTKATDFQPAGATFDSPGAWFEGRYLYTFHGAMGANLLIGSQLGEGKNFTYFGVGFAGWL